MIKVNTKDGSTLSFDMCDDKERKSVTGLLKERLFRDSVTGLSSLHNTFWHALLRPKRFRNVQYFVEQEIDRRNGDEVVKGEKIICQADDVQLSILIYYNARPKMARIELKKVGKQRFIPERIQNGTDDKKET